MTLPDIIAEYRSLAASTGLQAVNLSRLGYGHVVRGVAREAAHCAIMAMKMEESEEVNPVRGYEVNCG